jgi:RimJ/RimL family protein N-acetyltransferase
LLQCHSWLNKPHIQEFWDNSKEHHDDIRHFAEGRKTPAVYHDGIYSYWLGAVGKDLFCMIMTPKIVDDHYIYRNYLLQIQTAYSLDFCIGNNVYLGHGLAAPALKGFMEYFKQNIDPSIEAYFIDPNKSNPRAKHVYQNAGFKAVGEFVREKGFFTGQSHDLLIKKYRPDCAPSLLVM